jgi:hypothetical protein
MSKKSFLVLYHLLNPFLRPKDRLDKRSRRIPKPKNQYWMPVEIKIVVTLRFLAGGQVYDSADNFGYDRSTVYRAMHETIEAICKCPRFIKSVDFKHNDKDWLKEKSRLYQNARVYNPFGNLKCVGALDGLAIEIRRPFEDDQSNQYANRKGFFAIVCQGICDADYRFIYFDCSSPGSTHDSVAFGRTSLFPHLVKGLPENYWIACDAAYPLVGSMMKPFPGKTRDNIWEDSYNFHLSSLRITIENSFGIFIQRWGIFWRCLRMDPVPATKIITTCVYLHNFIIDEEGGKNAKQLLQQQEHNYFTFYQDDLFVESGNLRERIASLSGYGKDLRDSLVSSLSCLGLLRP